MNSKNIARRTLLLLFSIVCAAYSHAQSVVQGSVKDASGEPLIGATVQVKGVQGGTVTDINGHYVLSDVKNNATLVFSYIGYRNKEVAVGHQTTVNGQSETRRFCCRGICRGNQAQVFGRNRPHWQGRHE